MRDETCSILGSSVLFWVCTGLISTREYHDIMLISLDLITNV